MSKCGVPMMCTMLILFCHQGYGNPGLTVVEGKLLKDDQPYFGIGANYFSLFLRLLKNPNDTSYDEGLKQLSDAGIPFVRFMCGGFWPVDNELYLKDKESYFRLLDKVVESAEKHCIGLIPSLFWHMPTVPDIVGEPIDQLGNPNSKTIEFIRIYTEEVVTRYRNSPAIWAWEMSNELNLAVDLPNAAEHRPPVWPSLGTATSRTERDELKSEHMIVALTEFARVVRKYDGYRPIISGNALPRPSAYHNTLERSWKRDTPEQFAEILARDNPDPINTISVHVYPDEKAEYPGGAASIDELIEMLMKRSSALGKPLFIGEFGASARLGHKKERSCFEEMLAAIVRNRVPLAAFWVFDLSSQDGEWNVTADNERAYMLKLVRRANESRASHQ